MSLSPQQTKAVKLLLSGKTRKEASQACNVSLRTLQRWLASDEFRQALEGVCANVQEETFRQCSADLLSNQDRLSQLVERSLDILEKDFLHNLEARASDRLRAIQLILNHNEKLTPKLDELNALTVLYKTNWLPLEVINEFISYYEQMNQKMIEVFKTIDVEKCETAKPVGGSRG